MANAKSGVHVVQLKPVKVPKLLTQGEKFIKWDEDSQSSTPVTLYVDQNGFFLYWIDQNNETDILDISFIRDTRCGKYSRTPKEVKLRESLSIGQSESLEQKMWTVVHGTDFVNVNYINFCGTKSETVKVWAEELLKMSCNLLATNASAITFLKKAHCKLTLIKDRNGNIPIKNIYKIFAQHKDDRKRVEKALEVSGMPCNKNESIDHSKFSFEDFLFFYKNLTDRQEISKIFETLCESNGFLRKKNYLTIDQLVNFLNKEQRDPRLNEILYPHITVSRGKELIKQYEPIKAYAQKYHLSEDGFLNYLLSDDNAIIPQDKLDLSDDMDQSLCHYFINSSHNTYLTGHQLTGKSSVEMYRQCLLAGCRCVELDFWNGRTEEPMIFHGYTLVPEILAKDVIEAIAESAFKTSNYPVILSFENHCNQKQQFKIAQYCREYFGDMLLDKCLPNFQLESGYPLPSPNHLLRKIIIKNKKKNYSFDRSQSKMDDIINSWEIIQNSDVPKQLSEKDTSDYIDNLINGEFLEVSDENSSCSEEEGEEILNLEGKQEIEKTKTVKSTENKESEAGAEISALVNYIQPVHFYSFEISEKINRSYEMSSFVETQATTLLKEQPVEFVNYNKRQLSRVYPRGTRVDSSNFMPQVYWNAGCQLVALNFQTLDLAMQLNLGIFEFNNRSGYLLKPEFMRRPDRHFDPFAESTVDGIIAGSVAIKFLSDKRIGTFVEVEMYGLPADTVRKKFRTKIVTNNAINPIYNEEPFIFKKVVLPDLASIRILVCEESGRMLGQRILPVRALRPGYRHISLRNESNQPLMLPTIFVHIQVHDYIPDGLSDFAEALANPIKYQELEKRAQQLRILMDEEENFSPVDTCHISLDDVKEVNIPETNVKNTPLFIPSELMECHHVKSDSQKQFEVESISEITGISKFQYSRRISQNPKDELEGDVVAEFEASSQLITTEPVSQLLEHKVIKDKLVEFEKKLDAIHKKFSKEKRKILQEQQKEHQKLVKKLSRKSESSLKLNDLERKHSEQLLNLDRGQMSTEIELLDRFLNSVFALIEKLVSSSQKTQLETLNLLYNREIYCIKRRMAQQNLKETKALSQKHKDKDELDRIKREINGIIIQKGIEEIEKLKTCLRRRKQILEHEHAEGRRWLEEERIKMECYWRHKITNRPIPLEVLDSLEGVSTDL